MGRRVRWFRTFMDIRRSELPLALLMFAFFFLVTTIYWILKPIKKSVLVSQYAHHPLHMLGWSLGAAQAEQLAKVANMVVAFIAVYFFTSLARRMRRERLAYVFIGFCAVCNLGFLVTLGHDGPVTAWLFYVYGDLFNTVMIAAFFAFLNDSFTPEPARRTYGLIVLGGVVGGAVGSSLVRTNVSHAAMSGWLLVTMVLTLALVPVAWAAGRRVAIDESAAESSGSLARIGSPALRGARLVARSRYLVAMVTMVFVYELVSAILDFQFTSTVVHSVMKADIERVFSTVFMVTNIAALLIQLLLTSAVMSRLGVRTALLVMPLAILLVSGGYLALPTLFLAGALSSVDHSLSYSLNQSAREALYTPTARVQKYEAKAFIDMFVQRFGKALAVVINIGMTVVFVGFTGVRYLSIIVIGLVGLWMLAASYAGRRFGEVSASQLPAEVDENELPGPERRVIRTP